MSLVNKKGVDISYWNGNIDLKKVKNAGYEFVMIRCGFGSNSQSQDDSRFEENVKKAEALGMPWGAYFYTYSLNADQDKSELQHILRLLKGKKPTLPIAIDVEDADGYKSNHGGWNYANVNRNTKYLLKGLEKNGYYPILYTGFDEIERLISKDVWQKYDMWFAHWARKCGYTGKNLAMWQYGGETNLIDGNSIPGVGTIDKDLCYKDYPTIIKQGGYNNWPKTTTPTTKPTTNNTTPSTKPATDTSSKTTGSSAIKKVQTWLNKNYKTGLTVDGVYGSKTKAALVKALQTELNKQANAKLVVDGVYGPKTNAAVFNIKLGSSGNITKVLQGLLICNGYSTNGFDGVFGNGTLSAVKSYQSKKKLVVDGVAGKNTFNALCK